MENVSRYVSIAYIVLGVILAWVLARSFELLLGLAGPSADPALVADLKLSALLGLLASVGLIVGVNRSERASTYVNEVAMEMTKVAWPTMDEIKKMAGWIVKELGPDVPLHFTRFHPMYKALNLPRTPPETGS